MSIWQWRAKEDLTSTIFPSWTETLTKHLTQERNPLPRRKWPILSNYKQITKKTSTGKSPLIQKLHKLSSSPFNKVEAGTTLTRNLSFPTCWTWAGFRLQKSTSSNFSSIILFFHCLFKDLTPSHLWLLENTNILQKICLWSHKPVQLLPEITTAHLYQLQNWSENSSSHYPSYRLSEVQISVPLRLAWEGATSKPIFFLRFLMNLMANALRRRVTLDGKGEAQRLLNKRLWPFFVTWAGNNSEKMPLFLWYICSTWHLVQQKESYCCWCTNLMSNFLSLNLNLYQS